MGKRSKQYNELAKLVDPETTYPVTDALALVKKTATTKFDSSIEVHVRLGIDPKKGDQQVRSTVVLPHGIGKTKRIAAFVDASKEKEALAAGADIAGGESLIEEIKKTGKINFDIAVATPDMMRTLAPLARLLGPRGLMPSPKNETITTDLAKTIGELKKGKIAFKNDDGGNIHQVIGKASFEDSQLLENYTTFIEAVAQAKPEAVKATFIKKVYLCSTMGPSVSVEL